MFRLIGTGLITGAAEGLGASIAARFAREGARVILTDIQGDKVAATAAAIGGVAIAFQHDVASEADWRRVIDAALQDGHALARSGAPPQVSPSRTGDA